MVSIILITWPIPDAPQLRLNARSLVTPNYHKQVTLVTGNTTHSGNRATLVTAVTMEERVTFRAGWVSIAALGIPHIKQPCRFTFGLSSLSISVSADLSSSLLTSPSSRIFHNLHLSAFECPSQSTSRSQALDRFLSTVVVESVRVIWRRRSESNR
jgi:hypothetical protein